VAYKDIMSNERRARFGITENNSCQICGAVESVEHQLFECSNASRMWSIVELLTRRNNDSYMDRIYMNDNYGIELVKSVIFKLLIQIDRSRHATMDTVKKEIIKWLSIEIEVLTKSGRASLVPSIEALLNNDALCYL
ncbi:MAG: zinc-binding domain-containing protein, partial [Sphingomonadales bacterium]|nr:zinc-binding domain-containing protein [Sphingomonadales bacterium]